MRPSFFLAAKAPAIKVYLTGDIKLWVLLYIKKLYDSYACAAYRHLLDSVISLALGDSRSLGNLCGKISYGAHFYENLPYGARWWLPPRTANICSVICTLLFGYMYLTVAQ